MSPFQLRCVDTGASLTLRRIDAHEWQACLEAGNVHAETPVYIDDTHFREPRSFERLFLEMAGDWRGWTGARKWSSLKGELDLECSIDRTGHITVRIRLLVDPSRGWRAEATVVIEAGQLDDIARQAGAFVQRR